MSEFFFHENKLWFSAVVPMVTTLIVAEAGFGLGLLHVGLPLIQEGGEVGVGQVFFSPCSGPQAGALAPKGHCLETSVFS